MANDTLSSKSSPLVSVIIPVFNAEKFVSEAVESVLKQEDCSFEIIIVNDGSWDGTEQKLTAYDGLPNVRIINSKVNKGKPSAVNLAFQIARGEFLTIVDGDDTLPPKSLAARQRKFTEKTSVVIGGFSVFDGKNLGGVRYGPEGASHSQLLRRLLFSPKTPFSLNACLIRREAWRTTGLFDERLKRAEDFDFAVRLLRTAAEIYAEREPVYNYRRHRSTFMHRWQVRWDSARFRWLAIFKNENFLRAAFIGPLHMAYDFLKLVYELRGDFRN